MTDYDGPEKRRIPGGMPEVLSALKDLQRGHREICRDIKCLHESIERYEPLLIRLSENESDYKKLRHAVMEKSIVGIVWVILGITVAALWHYFLNLIGRQ